MNEPGGVRIAYCAPRGIWRYQPKKKNVIITPNAIEARRKIIENAEAKRTVNKTARNSRGIEVQYRAGYSARRFPLRRRRGSTNGGRRRNATRLGMRASTKIARLWAIKISPRRNPNACRGANIPPSRCATMHTVTRTDTIGKMNGYATQTTLVAGKSRGISRSEEHTSE